MDHTPKNKTKRAKTSTRKCKRKSLRPWVIKRFLRNDTKSMMHKRKSDKSDIIEI